MIINKFFINFNFKYRIYIPSYPHQAEDALSDLFVKKKKKKSKKKKLSELIGRIEKIMKLKIFLYMCAAIV